MEPEAFAVFQEFPAGPKSRFQVDRHYLLYAIKGAMRLEAGGKAWTLPAARAALIRAGHPIDVTLPGPLTACSVQFAPAFTPDPAAALSVFEMTALARELVFACRNWPETKTPLDEKGRQFFRTLALVTWELAANPSPVAMPRGTSDHVRDALALTEKDLSATPAFDDIAAAVALTPRTLARRFSDELGMSWGHALRRLRILRAIEMLAEEHEPIASIAFAVGYGSLSGFNEAFLDITGKTPTEYRASFG